jgi:glycosyltransferase involved in cell wall biosynthesis
MTEADSDFRPSWLDYWNLHPQDKSFPEFNPNWRTAEHSNGVGFYAPWEEVYAGFPEHARRCAIALAKTGIPLHLRSIRGGMQFQTTRDHDEMLAYSAMQTALESLLTASVKNYDVEVWQTIAETTAFFRIAGPVHHWMDAGELAKVHSRRIISTVFERDRVLEPELECLRRVGQVWVGNPKDADMLKDSGIDEERVHVIPIPYFPDDPHLALADKPRRPGPPTFYHIGKWEPRKCHHNIIGAFLVAFEPGDARLFMKTSLKGPKLTTGYPESAQESVTRWLDDPRVKARWTREQVNADVRIIQQRLSARQMVQLHRTGDIYVTLSRGEGFDMPAYDAKLAAKRMIYTPSGGPESFAATGRDLVVPATGLVPCDPVYGWEGAQYIDYDFEVAVEQMRKAAAHPEPTPMTPQQLEHFSAARVGSAMREAVEQLREEKP